jgi:hypothetical protein
MAKTYSLKKQIPREVALLVAEELVKALPDTVSVGSLPRMSTPPRHYDRREHSPRSRVVLMRHVDPVTICRNPAGQRARLPQRCSPPVISGRCPSPRRCDPGV